MRMFATTGVRRASPRLRIAVVRGGCSARTLGTTIGPVA
jgi:hypothetical protein